MNSIEALIKEDNTKKKILHYVREPVMTGQLFRNYGDIIAKKYLKVPQYDRISEVDRNVTHFIDVNKYSYYDFTLEDFEIFQHIIDLENVIRYERIFRYDLSYFQSMEMVYGCTKFFLEFFKANHYDIILVHIVDEFVLDIMVRVAQYKGIQVIGFCANSYDKNYMQITIRGEYIKVRKPDEQEIANFLSFLQNRISKPYFLSRKVVYYNIFRKYFLYKAKYIIHYQLFYKLLGNYSYRFMMTRSETYPRNLKNIFGAPQFFYNSIHQIPDILVKERTVYIPLHYHPEASTDYWIKDPNYLTYYPSLLKVIRSYSERGFQVLIKEHTASYMQREISLYKALSKIENVYLISPFISTYEVLDHVEYVVVWTGTTGVEAFMQGKKVILAAGETYYSFGKLAKVGEEKLAKFPTQSDKREVAEAILSSFLPIL